MQLRQKSDFITCEWYITHNIIRNPELSHHNIEAFRSTVVSYLSELCGFLFGMWDGRRAQDTEEKKTHTQCVRDPGQQNSNTTQQFHSYAAHAVYFAAYHSLYCI